ncbi:MAG: hypothetical protein GY710_07860 [Desulfobacteraceae bacterium]|nr:hypothetical protein [Desulfobacteraceae bacterium]
MKLVKSLTINGEPLGLVREHVWLDMSTPGRADFTVRSPVALSGIVHLCIGDAARENLVDFFTGYIVKSHTVDNAQQRLFCRELSAVLWATLPVSVRNASLKDILGIYSRKTGLYFAVPDKPYAQTPCPAFQTIANGIHGMDCLGDIFGIQNYIWQQQGDGQIFAGSWEDSKWAGKPFELCETFFQDVQLDGTKTMQALPGLRPGVELNGQYITSLQLNEHFMVVTCEEQLSE